MKAKLAELRYRIVIGRLPKDDVCVNRILWLKMLPCYVLLDVSKKGNKKSRLIDAGILFRCNEFILPMSYRQISQCSAIC